jgi:hypothetical protein
MNEQNGLFIQICINWYNVLPIDIWYKFEDIFTIINSVLE